MIEELSLVSMDDLIDELLNRGNSGFIMLEETLDNGKINYKTHVKIDSCSVIGLLENVNIVKNEIKNNMLKNI